MQYDAILIVSFGGPESMADVRPFLKNVLRGKNVPAERVEAVVKQYELFDGVSPINGNNRSLIEALRALLSAQGPDLPIYWGNRNWHPMLSDTLRQMKVDGIKKALAFVTSAYSSYSGCRQYLEDIERARAEVGTDCPVIEKIRSFFNHPAFIEANADNLRKALGNIPVETRLESHVVFTAHSIPMAMAENCQYQSQLEETSRLVADAAGHASYRLAYQSRSGPPNQPWLGPDICDALKSLAEEGAQDSVVMPIGFTSDHMEVLFDLDTQAKAVAENLGINMIRAHTVGTHPSYIAMIRQLILERTEGQKPLAVGRLPACPNVCPDNCCPH